MIDRKGFGSILVCLLVMLGSSFWAAGTVEACVAPPPEPFCTKALTLAMAGPPTLVLPGGGSFTVPLVLVFKLLDFPPGTGICPMPPHTVDVQVEAVCTPAGDGSGSLLGQSVSTGFNLLDVTVTVPAGPPRVCELKATATLTLSDGMVLTETAESSACLVEPAPDDPTEPRIELEMVGLAGEEIARTHPGDPVTRTYRITNHDSDESFTGTLSVNSVSESRMPGMSGPAPEGTTVVSISDPVQGDNFPFAVSEVPAFLRAGTGDLFCIPFTDPHEVDISEQDIEIVLGPNSATVIEVVSRPWGMCADGSCGRHDLFLTGDFSDEEPGFGCSTFVTAADTSVPSGRSCDDGGEVGKMPPPANPNLGKLTLSGSPFVDFEPLLDIEISQIALRENGIVIPDPHIPFSGHFEDELGRIQAQWPGDFAVKSFFDIFVEIQIGPSDDGPTIDTEVVSLSMTGAPTGFERTAPFAMGLTEITDLSGSGLRAFAEVTAQLNAVGIDELGNRRRLQFQNIQFLKFPDGSGLRGALTGGLLEAGEGNDIIAVEMAMDLRGFFSPEPQNGFIFEDGFESGNVTRWSLSSP